MTLALLAIIGGFVLLVWSADRFIEGAAAAAGHAGMPSLLIGMVIVGFGTSAPEMVVSAMAALDDNPALALGNALGSNIVNIGLVLGVTALLSPIAVHSNIVRRELPLLLLINLLLAYLLWDHALTRPESLLLVTGFGLLVLWSIFSALSHRDDSMKADMDSELAAHSLSLNKSIAWLIVGLVLLIASSRVLVWGAVNIAQLLGISDLIIGLTIVALGTSLPELAASVIAARKGEHDIAVGNVVGSCMFNILAVAGIAGLIRPITDLTADILARDWSVMMGLTVILLIVAYGFRGTGRINRGEGGLLLLVFIVYNSWLIMTVTGVIAK